MFISILRVKIDRFIDNRFYWFCQYLIRRSIEVHFITRFRYSFYEDIFFNEFVTILSIFISLKSFISSRQQKLKITSEISKIVKQNKFKKISKAEQIVKSTLTLSNIDIFDSTACNESEFELYNVIANFLQNFQQCRHQYRKSSLLNLLFKCLCDRASEWFKTQFEFISLKRFDRILAKAFSEASIRHTSRSSNFQLSTLDVISKSIEISSDFEITNVRAICKFCKQNFNFNKKLYEHIRSHETFKLVKNSHLSINAVNLVCEIEKKSFVSQKSHESFTKFQKSIFEFAIAFEAVTLLKRSIFQFFALEIASKSTKKLSTCRHCDEIFNFKKSFREHKREQHAKNHVINSSFQFHTFKSVCETEKKSIIKNMRTLFVS